MYFEKYGSAFTHEVRSASWPLSPSVRASVNGTSNTVGRVPAASFAAKVGPVHWYSTGLTLIDGLAFSNCATCALNCWIACGVLPGISDATLIVTDFVVDPTAAAAAHTASRPRPRRPWSYEWTSSSFLSLTYRVLGFVRAGNGGLILGLAEPDGRVLQDDTSFELVA